mmetsp:Transcript_4690/g.6887  ORF Transcript_4690/g.6887 Transcript_4690/m.6887 type:complete len:180 (+) Transcript_4690:136-675(+)
MQIMSSSDYSTIGSASNNKYAYSNLNVSADDHIKRLKIFALLCVSVSLFFWSWAVLNTYNMSGGFDFGVISFFLSGASSVYLLRMSRKGANGFVESPPTYISRVRVLVFLSHFTVAMNYAIGGYLAFGIESKDAQFAYYCIIFMVLWLFCAAVGWNLITNVMDINAEELDNLNVFYDLE